MYRNPERVYVNSAAFHHVSDADIKVMRYYMSVGDEYGLRRFYDRRVAVISKGLAPPSYEHFLIYVRNS